MIVSCKYRSGPDIGRQILGNRPGDRHAVVSARATPDFVQMDNDFNKAQQLVAGWKAQQQ